MHLTTNFWWGYNFVFWRDVANLESCKTFMFSISFFALEDRVWVLPYELLCAVYVTDTSKTWSIMYCRLFSPWLILEQSEDTNPMQSVMRYVQYHWELLFRFSFDMRTQPHDSMHDGNSIHSKIRLTFCSTSAGHSILMPGCLAGRMTRREGGKDRPLTYPCLLQGRQNCSHSHAENYLVQLGKQQRGQRMQISSWFPNRQGQMHHHWQHQVGQLWL